MNVIGWNMMERQMRSDKRKFLWTLFYFFEWNLCLNDKILLALLWIEQLGSIFMSEIAQYPLCPCQQKRGHYFYLIAWNVFFWVKSNRPSFRVTQNTT